MPRRPSLHRAPLHLACFAVLLLTASSLAIGLGSPLAWRTLPLVDARTGATFTIADLGGRTVFVEPMATWCSSCRRQMIAVREVAAALDPDAFVFLGLSVETNLAPAALASYVDAQGFGWTFAVMSPELLAALVDTFGRSVTNPPATPHFIVRPDGSATTLATGYHDVGKLLTALTAAATP
jgi:thiol-disulfide isomerase/thioredoxin